MNPRTAMGSTFSNGWMVAIATAAAGLVVFVGWLGFRAQPMPPQNSAAALVTEIRTQLPFWCVWLDRSPTVRKVLPGWQARVFKAELQLRARRNKAESQLIKLGTNAWPVVPELLRALQEGNPERMDAPCWAALHVLGLIKAEEHPDWKALSTCLQGKAQAARVFASSLPHPGDAFSTSSNLRESPHLRLCILGLAATGRAGASARPALLKLLQSPQDSPLWPAAVTALQRVGAQQGEYIANLVAALQDSEQRAEARAAAADALALVSPEPADVRALFRRMMNDPSSHVRLASARALWTWKAPAEELLPTLKGLLGHKLVSIRKGALTLLAEMGPAALPVRPEIERLAQADADEPVRTAAAMVLRVLRGPTRVQADRNPAGPLRSGETGLLRN